MSILARILDPPRYPFEIGGSLYVPKRSEILAEFFSRMNVFRSRKNWLPLFGWTASGALAIPFFIFIFKYFSWPLLIIGAVYSMVILGSHGTVWLHRFATHRAFDFSHPVYKFVCRNLVIKIIPEEIYVVSHHVHHCRAEKPGDPYNTHAGWLYCFLADVNHQPIAKDLGERDYEQICKLVAHTGVKTNTYAQYQRWGSICHPLTTFLHYALNWAFWYGILYLIGGHALATAIFGLSVIWAFGVRTFNYDGHGRGQDRRRRGIDFNWDDYSVNQLWPGFVAGEWHNNHHLYPNSVRSGFLPYQLDLPWLFIRFYRSIGGIKCWRDHKAAFIKDHYEPYLLECQAEKLAQRSLS